MLFVDISGFTPLTEKLGNKGSRGVEELTNVLNQFFTLLIDVIDNHGGDVIKFAGDALLAIWPTNSELSKEDLSYAVLMATQVRTSCTSMFSDSCSAQSKCKSSL